MKLQSEQERLKELRNLKILDSHPEPEFDDLTELASLICKTPISIISLVDESRQWFKSSIGLAVSETPRDISFCTHAIKQPDLFIVENASQNPLFANSPLCVEDPHIQFYAGAPLVTSRGAALGTLCVADRKPRTLTDEQQVALSLLARLVVRQIETRNQSHKISRDHIHISSLLESQQAGIVVEDHKGVISYINSHLFKIFKLNPHCPEFSVGLQNDKATMRLKPLFAHPNRFAHATEEHLKGREASLNEEFLLTDDRWVERDYSPLLIEGEIEGHIWVYRDITQRKRNEELIEYQKLQMTESQRLSSLGEMASNIAHEINNPLAVIYGRAIHLFEMGKAKTVTHEQVQKYSGEIVEVTNRLTKIVKGLRTFARVGDNDAFETKNVATLVSDTLALCQQRFKEAGLAVKLNSIDPELAVSCRHVQISQILLNLLNNAFDATQNLAEKWVEIDAFEVSDEVVIAVKDSGLGISKEVQQKIFSPFFTTKKSSQGTGLGLSISRRIAEEHKGTLALDESSSNTRFILRIPTATQRIKSG